LLYFRQLFYYHWLVNDLLLLFHLIDWRFDLGFNGLLFFGRQINNLRSPSVLSPSTLRHIILNKA
jgi:hypothetical protein